MEAMLFFAATETAAENNDLLGSLGIDVRLLIVQSLAFLVLLWVLSKYVYPVISGMLEKREAAIRQGVEMAENAEKNAAQASERVDKMLSDARKQASEVIATAKDEASSIVATANESAARQTERMVDRANAEIEKEVETARQKLREETIDLVALATEKVLGNAMTETIDKKVVASALQDIEK